MDLDGMHSRPELLAAGITDDEIKRAVDAEELTRVRRGTYTAGAPPTDAEIDHVLRVHAALPELSPDAVVSHVSAALLHRIPLWGVPLAQVCVSRNRRTGGRCGSQVHVFSAPLEADEIVLVDGVAVTSPARTVVDLARHVPFEQAVVAADGALRLGLVKPEELAGSLERGVRRPGAPGARRAVAFADGRSESAGESRSRVAIHCARLPAPDLQVEVRDARGRLLGRTDFGWRDRHVVGEFDGRQKYGRLLQPNQDPGDIVFAEKRREDAIRAVGESMVRWCWSDLRSFGPTADRIRTALGLDVLTHRL